MHLSICAFVHLHIRAFDLTVPTIKPSVRTRDHSKTRSTSALETGEARVLDLWIEFTHRRAMFNIAIVAIVVLCCEFGTLVVESSIHTQKEITFLVSTFWLSAYIAILQCCLGYCIGSLVLW